MSRISLAFKSFFAILFGDGLPAEVAKAYGFTKESAAKPAPKPVEVRPADGALQILGILQRDARLIDFLMEDISPYSDEQVGAAVRQVNEQGRASLPATSTVARHRRRRRHTPASTSPSGRRHRQADRQRAPGRQAAGGILRHKGWRVERIDLPKPAGDLKVLAPAEIEIE